MISVNKIVFSQKMQYRDYSHYPATVIQHAVGHKIYNFAWLQRKITVLLI